MPDATMYMRGSVIDVIICCDITYTRGISITTTHIACDACCDHIHVAIITYA